MSNLSTFQHRSMTVVLLSLVSMVACFMWWGKLPIGFLQIETTESKGFRPAWAPPFLFQSEWVDNTDDEVEFTGDDDNYKEGERIRSMDKMENKKRLRNKNASNSTKQNFAFENYKERPKIVWLMSYPNSGTSYTMTMVSRASNRAIASNYGREVTEPPTFNTPLYPGEDWSWNGPFYKPDPRKPLPDDYVLVKTHCGGRCTLCGPDRYVMTEKDFFDECRRGSGLFPKEVQKRVKEMQPPSSSNALSSTVHEGFQIVHYNASLVKKAIHLYRNPFDNIVSRFHLERIHWAAKKMEREIKRYTNDAEGFQRWCKDSNAEYGPKPNKPNKFLPKDVVRLMQGVPCHGEIYRYTQWHNLANAVINHNNKTNLIIHYENYDKKWNETAGKILDFLHLEMQGTNKDFSARHDYDPYFTPTQRSAAKALMQRVATKAVWRQLERYFQDVP
ncbi:expressed unknown protein [Seminavis robusta]|uniref:Sulfotransferase domain-containing protein n=1 Tax=Seminavis robusta TaxID=568900 RepID=A0A9N8E346_9STRA|nr:expressed unknown protein [Seminavis robusta]|eukprot:Sro601_g173490.1 n/a (445) ;mRNA; r:17990-19409